MVRADWNELYYQRFSGGNPKGVLIGKQLFEWHQTLEFGAKLGSIEINELEHDFMKYLMTAHRSCRPQFAAYFFNITHRPAALNPYFPLTETLDKAGLKNFYELIQHIIRSPGFDLRLLDENLNDLWMNMPAHVVYLVAGHIAEIFFYCRDILERFLNRPRHIWLYTTPEAFAKDGGVSGGCYDSKRECLQLVLSRLYEGFNAKKPGVAPFLHEFGHMLDHLDAAKSSGLLPGMRPWDREIYTPEAHKLFIQGQELELKRYLKFYKGNQKDGDLPPIGHPYVFQNDTEFIAGYFEMFFRNPYYFAEMNPDLYQGFALLFRQDPRQAWEQDFPYYVQQNRDFYLKSGKRPGKPGLTIP